MKNNIISRVLAVCTLCVAMGAALPVRAQGEASALSTLSALPVASVVVGASAVAGSAIAVPVVLSTAGTVLVVKTVESTARGTLYVLERASDGARVSVEIVGRGVASVSAVAGTVVVVSVIGAGVVLSAAGEAIAYIPNALGRALLHNERLTH